MNTHLEMGVLPLKFKYGFGKMRSLLLAATIRFSIENKHGRHFDEPPGSTHRRSSFPPPVDPFLCFGREKSLFGPHWQPHTRIPRGAGFCFKEKIQILFLKGVRNE